MLIVHAKIAFRLSEALGPMTDMLHSSDAIKRLSITWAGMGRLCTSTAGAMGRLLRACEPNHRLRPRITDAGTFDPW